MPDAPLLVSRDGALLRLTINRPEKRNALSLALLDEIGATVAGHAADATILLAVITGSGDKCFAAGGDLQELDAIRSADDTRAMSKRGRAALQAIRDFPVPVVAALNGHALGGGAELALACDLRVAARHAEIGFLQAQLAVTTAWGGGIDLAAAIGRQQAQQLLASARRLPAPEAQRLGVVDRICAPDQGIEECLADFLQPYLQRKRQVLAGIKSLMAAARRRLHADLGAIEEEQFVRTWTHADHWAAVAAAMPQRTRGQA
jgi:enoyl-CoA hydratase